MALAISNLMQQMPGQNKQVATGLQEAAKTQLQAGLGGQGPTGQPMGVRQVQQAGAQATAAQGQAAIAAQQQGAEKAGQLGEMAVQEQAAEAQQRLQTRQLGLQRQQRDMDSQLKNYNAQLHTELVEKQTQFQKDEMGRTLFNDRQLIDYKLATAKSQLELKNLESQMRQTSSKRMAILDASRKRLSMELEQEYAKSEREKYKDSILKIEQENQRLEKKMQEERAKANARASMLSSGGALIGMGVLLAVPGSFGIAAYGIAAAVGAGTGQVAGNQWFPKM
jgi:hypothetical protein